MMHQKTEKCWKQFLLQNQGNTAVQVQENSELNISTFHPATS